MSALFYRIARILLPRSLRLRLLKYRGPNLSGRLSLARRARGTVVGGPFAGLRYGSYSIGSEYFPKILGSYELELHGAIEWFISQCFRRAIIVGSGEGYYAGGLALRCPQLQIIAYETDPAGQACLRALAARSGSAGRISVNGHCTPEILERALAAPGPNLVIMDVEGGERELLDPVRIPDLLSATVLVELHDFIIPGLSEVIAGRFAASHENQIIDTRPRTLSDAAKLGLPAHWRTDRFLALLDEGRPGPMQWLLITPRNAAQPC